MIKQINVANLRSAKSIQLFCSPAVDFMRADIFRFSVKFDDDTEPTHKSYSSIWMFNANQRVDSTLRFPVPAGKKSCIIEIETDVKSEHIFESLIVEGLDVNDRPVFHLQPEGMLKKTDVPA